MTIDDSFSENACPYCGSINSCEHLLLSVDLTFRCLGAGALYDRVEDLWSTIRHDHQENDDFDESELFDELLEEASRLSSAECEWDAEGGPGQSSSYKAFYCETVEAIDFAVANYCYESSSDLKETSKTNEAARINQTQMSCHGCLHRKMRRTSQLHGTPFCSLKSSSFPIRCESYK